MYGCLEKFLCFLQLSDRAFVYGARWTGLFLLWSFWYHRIKVCWLRCVLYMPLFGLVQAVTIHTLLDFLANLLAHSKKITEKSVFCKAWCPEMTSCNFQSPVFRLAVLYPTGSEIKTWGRKIVFYAILISTLWGFYLANKKTLSYTL